MGEHSQLDIDPRSSQFTVTPTPVSRQLPLYVESWGHFYARRRYMTQRDGIQSYLLFYTTGGSGYLRYRGQEYSLVPGSVAVIDCGEPQRYGTQSGEWIFHWVHFNGASAATYYHLLMGDSPAPFMPDDPMGILRRMEQIPALLSQKGVCSDVKTSTWFIGFITELIESKAVLNGIVAPRGEIDTVLAYIESHYSQNIHISDMADIVHMSKYHFERVFKKHMGISPYDYLLHCRINRTKVLLHDTGRSIKEISGQTGFGNVNNFIRHFKRIVGVTPGEYRRHWAE